MDEDVYLGEFRRGPAIFTVFSIDKEGGIRVDCSDGNGPGEIRTLALGGPARWFGAWNGDEWCPGSNRRPAASPTAPAPRKPETRARRWAEPLSQALHSTAASDPLPRIGNPQGRTEGTTGPVDHGGDRPALTRSPAVSGRRPDRPALRNALWLRLSAHARRCRRARSGRRESLAKSRSRRTEPAGRSGSALGADETGREVRSAALRRPGTTARELPGRQLCSANRSSFTPARGLGRGWARPLASSSGDHAWLGYAMSGIKSWWTPTPNHSSQTGTRGRPRLVRSWSTTRWISSVLRLV